VIEFVSSPGPFKTRFRRAVAKLMYRNIDLFLNRESVSTELLKQLGIKKPILNTACPALLLEPAPPERGKEILLNEGVDITSRPLVGITLSGYNLSQRTWGKREGFKGIELFLPTLKWLLDELKANVILLPHVYRANPYVNEYELINGPGHDILLTLFRMVDGERYSGKIRLIEGKFATSEAKAVIGQCDMFLAGRLHAGAAALSQGVPTVLFAYGHKHRGFARLFGQEKFAYSGNDSEELLSLVKEVWQDRTEIKKTLQQKMPRVSDLVHLNFEIVKEITALSESERNHLPVEMIGTWIQRSQ
jgi:colanic acid/amylovoran biosynthesis protein